MSLTKTGVFLASRFKEFEQLRTSLKVLIAAHRVVQFSPIDLNDGTVTHRPPLSECLAFVRRAEFMVLLLGDTYGSLAPGSDKSFTHLEYLEAMRNGSKTRVLVFCIGDSYRNGQIDYCRDYPVFAGWQRQLEASHTKGYLPHELSTEDKGRAIFDHLLAALYDMRFGQLGVDDEAAELDDAFDDDPLGGDDEVNRLESINAQARGLALLEDRDISAEPLQALMKPAALASREQREEADRAIRLGEYGLAMQHLKQSLKLRHLDLKSNYWLAQLLLSMGRKDKLVQVMELGERAARIATDESLPIRAAAGYMLAARAARDSGLLEEAGRLTSNALEQAPGYAKAHLEKARLHVAEGNKLSAIGCIREAYQCYSPSLKEVYGDPVFRPIRHGVNSLVNDLKNRLRNDILALDGQFQPIDKYLGRQPARPDLESCSLGRLMDYSSAMLRKRYDDVCLLWPHRSDNARYV